MKENPGKKAIKVLIAKPGLDGHDRGAKVIIHALKDAGMDVKYTGLHNTIDEIVNIAVEENVNVIGLSIYSGAHLALGKKLMARIKEKRLTNKLVLMGGNIPQKDIDTIKKYGVDGVFPTGSSLDDIVNFIKKKIEG